MLSVLAACATGGMEGPDGGVDVTPDAMGPADAEDPAPPDGAIVAPPDAGATDAGATDAQGPDAAPPAPDACVPDWIELLANPGLDSGAAPWLQVGAVIAADADIPITPQAGGHAGRLAGANNESDELWQMVTVPAGATQLRLRVYECFVTSDTVGADDTFTAQIRDATGAPLETVRSATNLDAPAVCAWQLSEWPVAGAYAGQTIQLHLRGTSDALYPTSFYVDTLSLEALACP
jgi:hypothetical protein